MSADWTTDGRKWSLPAWVVTAAVVLDQLSKAAVSRWLGPDEPERVVPLVGSVVALEYVENRGAAFGVLRGQGTLLSLVALVVLVGLVAYYRRVDAPSAWLGAAVGLIAGGAVGNLIDRLHLGYVIDFIAVGPWPKFNVADSAITVGVLLLAGYGLRPAPANDQAPAPPRAGPPRPADG